MLMPFIPAIGHSQLQHCLLDHFLPRVVEKKTSPRHTSQSLFLLFCHFWSWHGHLRDVAIPSSFNQCGRNQESRKPSTPRSGNSQQGLLTTELPVMFYIIKPLIKNTPNRAQCLNLTEHGLAFVIFSSGHVWGSVSRMIMRNSVKEFQPMDPLPYW